MNSYMNSDVPRFQMARPAPMRGVCRAARMWAGSSWGARSWRLVCAVQQGPTTVNVRTQEAIEVLAVYLYHREKLILESHTFLFQKFNTRQLFRPFGNSSVVSIIRIRLAFSFALIWFPAQAAKTNRDDSKL